LKKNIKQAAISEEAAMTLWIYINTNVPIGDSEHVKTFADQDVADKWFRQRDPEGVAFEYPVIGELYERMIRKPAS